MGLCSICRFAMQRLHASRRLAKASVSVEFSPHSSTPGRDCWICYQYTRTLRHQDPEFFRNWETGRLQSVFEYEGDAELAEETETDEVHSLDFSIKPVVDGEEPDEDHGCCLTCYFAPDHTQLYPSAFTSSRTADYGPHQPSCNTAVIKKWIQDCRENHKGCNENRDESWFPTRLLQLSSGGRSMRLVLTQEQKPTGPYMTLSYRWGNPTYELLTSATIDNFRQSIDVSALPLAFQEAGLLCNTLGVEYLWIDSLCIKQDKDLEDWRREAPQMRHIYANSMLNVAATLSPEGGTIDLFTQEAPGPFEPALIEEQYVEANDGVRVALATPKTYCLIDGYSWEREFESAPLLHRAWVYQERVLPPRVLHFGHRQLGWECREKTALELFPLGLPSGLVTVGSGRVINLTLHSKDSRWEHFDLCVAWGALVRNYTKCALTKPEDKMIAFAGVAKLIEDAQHDQYLCGLWKNTLTHNLAWSIQLDKSKGLAACPAPSWSWLSSDRVISLPTPEEAQQEFVDILRLPDSDIAGSSVIQAHGIISLAGVLLPVDYIDWEKHDSWYSVGTVFSVAQNSFGKDEEGYESYIILDISHKDLIDLGNPTIQALPLYRTETTIHLLAVIQRENGEYRRVGTFSLPLRNYNIDPDRIPQGWRADTWEVGSLTREGALNVASQRVLELIEKKRQEVPLQEIDLS